MSEANLAEWVAAVGQVVSGLATTAAVIVALWLSGRDERIRARERLRKQAEQITAWLIPYEGEQEHPHLVCVGLRLKNASDQVIYDLIAEIVAVQGAARDTGIGDTEERNRELGTLVGTLPPGELTTRIETYGGGMFLRYGVEIAFQDAAGRYWLRRGNGLLKQIDQHPLDLYGIGRPVSWEN
jgi:hypothetical protein